LAIIKIVLKTSKCLAKDPSQSNCNQYWGYIIPKTSITQWAGNIIFDAPLNSLKNSNVIMKVKTMEEEGIGV
jgi:hypothetical protein